jgi:hypothetical protein
VVVTKDPEVCARRSTGADLQAGTPQARPGCAAMIDFSTWTGA